MLGPLSTFVHAKDADYTVVLTNDGFKPSHLTVPLGARVVFTTTRGRYFWPASNDHPSHTLYAEFDPKEPISPDSSWSFQFEQPGVWKFHDHVSPSYTGDITVGPVAKEEQRNEKKGTVVSLTKSLWSKLHTLLGQYIKPLNYASCRSVKLDRGERIQCWERVVVAITQRKGLIAALNFVAREKNRNVAFASDCHVYVHRIGEEYYWYFFNNRQIEVSDKFNICDQGFFHGFMQEFASHGTNIIQAKRYCDLLMSQMGESNERLHMLRQQCYHGVGHGAAFLYAASYWGNTDEIIRRSISDCRSLIDGDPHLCISGVFGGMAAMYWGLHGFTLDMDISKPWQLCEHQPMPERVDCYDQLVPVVFSRMGLDLKTVGNLIEQIPEMAIRRVAMEHLGSMPSYTLVPETEDYNSIILACRMFLQPLNTDCLHGFAGALVRIGPISEAQNRSTRFCQSDSMSESERAVCYDAVRNQIATHYSEKEASRYCQHITATFQHALCPIDPKE